MKALCALFLLVGSLTAQTVSVGAAGGLPPSNVLPSVSAGYQATSGGNVSSLAITAPTSPVSGNCGYIFIVAKGVTSETWTPAAGWSQVGSTLTSVVTSQVVTAIFTKTFGGSEPGTYTFSWNN